jgi:hypothetical protein
VQPDAAGCEAPRAHELRALARLQRELQRQLSAPSNDARAARAIGCSEEQVAVYRDMGTVRFVREVAREFPATRRLLGARFGNEARAFVRATESRSYTLDGYARRFPEHLRRGARANGDPVLFVAAELARLERECAAALRARAASRGVCSESPSPQLLVAPGARLHRFAWAVDVVLDRFERRVRLGSPRRCAIRVVSFRRDGRVARLRIARSQEALLVALLRGAALERAVACAVRAGATPAAIGRALERWVAARLLAPAFTPKEAA